MVIFIHRKTFTHIFHVVSGVVGGGERAIGCGGMMASGVDKESSKNFEGTITIVYYPNDKLNMGKKFIQELQRQLPKATLKIC